MAPPRKINPWDRQPGEPARWYDRFHTYLMLGPRRTLDAAFRVVMFRKEGRAPGLWWKKYKEWNWQERAIGLDKLGWDEMQQEQNQYARELRHRRMRMIQEIQDASFVGITNAQIDKMSPADSRDLLAVLRNLLLDANRQQRIDSDIELKHTREHQREVDPEVDGDEDDVMRLIWGDDDDDDDEDDEDLESEAV